MSRSSVKSAEERWKSEAEYFDREARLARERLEPIDPLTVERYGTLRRRRFNKEFRFRMMGDLRGKRVLDVGCGDGVNAMTLAKLGATVTGVDISPGAIELAEARAQVNGVSGSTRFVCSPLETADFAAGSFDVIWGDAVLHHLLDDLDGVLARLARWARPGAMMMFSEPVNLNATLRRLRFMLPVANDATPDERPLERQELALVRRHLPDLRVRYYNLFGRLDRFVLVRHNYERSPRPRKLLAGAIAGLDYVLLSLPPLQRLAGVCVLYGHTPRG